MVIVLLVSFLYEMMMCSTNTRSSLELMLDSIRQRDEQPNDVPPALPIRPVSRARLPPGRKRVPLRLQMSCLMEDPKENEVDNKEGNRADFVLKKIDSLSFKDDTREGPLEKILEIQKSFRGHQVRCYYLQLRRRTITIQSFVRGETARKNYQFLSRRLEAVIVIQRHTKQWVDWRTMQKRQRAVIILQSTIRGWLTRKSVHDKKNFRLPGIDYKEDIRKPGWINQEITDHIQVSPSVLADLRRRLHMVETELGSKEMENAAIRRRLRQYEEKWLEYEKKMKSMEKKWQDQLASLQMSLRAAKNSLTTERIPISLHNCPVAEDRVSVGVQTTHGRTMADIINSRYNNEAQPELRNNRVDDTIPRIEDNRRSSFQDDLRKSPDEEFQNLKLRFEVWKKDYEVRLQEAKTMLRKSTHPETKKGWKKWWGR